MSAPLQQPPVILTAGCKINLSLHIMGVRPDGYHELDTLFHPLPFPCDRLEIAPAPAGAGLVLECDRADLCTENNILHKTWRLFAEMTGHAPDLHVRLFKGIPDGAGLGGGSSDAAVFLNYLNRHDVSGKQEASPCGPAVLSEQQMQVLAARIGADVPFFLHNVPARATGIGEKLTPHPVDLKGLTLLLVCPPERVSTPWAYGAWDAQNPEKILPAGDAERLTSSAHMFTRPFSRALWLFNSFESVVFAAFPKLRAYKESLIRHGAAVAVMSGSGASLFGLYREMEKAMQAAALLETEGVRTYIHHL